MINPGSRARAAVKAAKAVKAANIRRNRSAAANKAAAARRAGAVARAMSNPAEARARAAAPAGKGPGPAGRAQGRAGKAPDPADKETGTVKKDNFASASLPTPMRSIRTTQTTVAHFELWSALSKREPRPPKRNRWSAAREIIKNLTTSRRCAARSSRARAS
jgi:hypothetical protein